MRVLDFAMEMDRRGRDLYRRLAAQAESEGARRIFAGMAEDEERLLARYRELQAAGLDGDSRTLDEVEIPFAAERIKAVGSGTEAFRLLRDIEGQACRLFETAASREGDEAARRALGEVARAECGELREIEQVCEFVNAPNEYLAWREFSNLDEFHNFGRYEGLPQVIPEI